MSAAFAAEILGIATHALLAGPELGTPVLLLHGWGASSALMQPVASRLAARGWRTITPDLPGFGASGLPPAVWGVPEYARWALALLDALQVPSAHLIGHSFGGRISLMLGAEHAARIGRIVLVDSAGIPPRRQLAGQIRLRTYKAARAALERLGQRGRADALRAWYGRRYGSSDYQSAGPLREVFVRVVNHDLSEIATRVQRPTLLVWGERDEDTPLWQGRALEQRIPDSGLVVLEGAGHYSYLEQPDRFVTIVDHFYTHD